MSHNICLSCLSRSLRQIEKPLSRASAVAQASFSTTSTHLAQATKSKAVTQRGKSAKTFVLAKNKPAATGKPPQPGERRAIRKRIVLSNTNALEVRGLQRLDKKNATAERLEAKRGGVLAFEDKTIDALRALEAFKTSQSWPLFRQAASLIRHDTVELARFIETVESGSEDGSRGAAHLVLTGERNSGKSVLQLQAMSMAHLKGWILIHIPDAQDLTNGTTAYQPGKDQDGNTTYIQPHHTAHLLGNILNANQEILSTMRLSREHNLPVPVPEDSSIASLLQLGARDPSIAWPVWEAVLQELTSASKEGAGLQRPPVLLSVDCLAHLMKDSEYFDPNMKKIHAHDLALVKSLVGYLDGTASMESGGLVLGCTSGANRPKAPTFDFVLEERYAQGRQQSIPTWQPYAKRDERVYKAMQGVQVHKLSGVTKDEAKGAMEYYALSGIYRNSVTDALVAEKLCISGGGIMGELERSCIKQRA